MPENDVTEMQKALLGFLERFDKAMQATPQALASQTGEMYKLMREFNNFTLDAAMKGNVSTHDKALLEKTRDVIEQQIHPYIEANAEKRQEFKTAVTKATIKANIEAVKQDIEDRPSFKK